MIGRAVRWMLAALLLVGVGMSVALYLTWIRIPPNWAPWGTVWLDQRPSWFARMQVNSLAADAEACFAALDRSDLSYRRLDARPLRNGCGLPDGGARIARSHVEYDAPFESTCALAAALRWYERRLVLLAIERFGQPLARIEHWGTYACRNVERREEARRSQHATANAIDIAAFRLADGSRISVRHDWGRETPQGRFLADARDEACRFFNAVLGPDYNRAHADHFHLDLGRARICR